MRVTLQWEPLPYGQQHGWFADLPTGGRWIVKRPKVSRLEWVLLFNGEERGRSRDPDELKRQVQSAQDAEEAK
jgi:hypothetical protein